jgi:hypothetical protein
MLFFVTLPLWLGLLIWGIQSLSNAPAQNEAAKAAALMLELQAVAAMTDEMKEAYWARKQAEAEARAEAQAAWERAHPPMSLAKAWAVVAICFISVFIIADFCSLTDAKKATPALADRASAGL